MLVRLDDHGDREHEAQTAPVPPRSSSLREGQFTLLVLFGVCTAVTDMNLAFGIPGNNAGPGNRCLAAIAVFPILGLAHDEKQVPGNSSESELAVGHALVHGNEHTQEMPSPSADLSEGPSLRLGPTHSG